MSKKDGIGNSTNGWIGKRQEICIEKKERNEMKWHINTPAEYLLFLCVWWIHCASIAVHLNSGHAV